MPGIARIVAVGEPHHISQRGNNQQDVIFMDDDKRVPAGDCLAGDAEIAPVVSADCWLSPVYTAT